MSLKYDKFFKLRLNLLRNENFYYLQNNTALDEIIKANISTTTAIKLSY